MAKEKKDNKKVVGVRFSFDNTKPKLGMEQILLALCETFGELEEFNVYKEGSF